MKIIKIPTDISKIFKQYLYLINGLLSKEKKLNKVEIEILDKLLYIDHLYKDQPKDRRDKILFHSETKNRIRESLDNLSRASFDNTLSSLRKKGMIVGKSLKINIPLVDNKIEIGFKLDLNE